MEKRVSSAPKDGKVTKSDKKCKRKKSKKSQSSDDSIDSVLNFINDSTQKRATKKGKHKTTGMSVNNNTNMNLNSPTQFQYSIPQQDINCMSNPTQSPAPIMHQMQNVQSNVLYPLGTPVTSSTPGMLDGQSGHSGNQVMPYWVNELFHRIDGMESKLTALSTIRDDITVIKSKLSTVDMENKRLDSKIKDIEKSTDSISKFFTTKKVH